MVPDADAAGRSGGDPAVSSKSVVVVAAGSINFGAGALAAPGGPDTGISDAVVAKLAPQRPRPIRTALSVPGGSRRRRRR
jgi:hypothetical protein